ncbi:phage morphogenesis protein [Duncaniella freteri]|jgi:phage gpG-like protein|uniref:Phage morphogenesis protein n=1 Tax=Duncaniella freteri TaxID=2530391 RepID=A0A4Z0V8Q2_9BACT|nr:phage morphogenesis protein [Duncaniella freteri]TGG40527.1 phage morphogenesis protein [Duncaniella freteri]
MLDANKLKADILDDMRVDLSEEFDRNFERKGFFSDKWKPRAHDYSRGSLLMVSGDMRKATQGEVSGNGVRFSSAMPYTNLHNEDGKITVTAKMKRYFWAKFMQTKDESWRRMALMKVGKVITMPERRFIGDGPDTQRIIREAIDRNLQQFNTQLTDFLRQ